MKIAYIETFCNEFVGFVRITTDTGDTGWGQVSTYNADISVEVLHRQIVPWTLGFEIVKHDELADYVFEREHKFPGTYLKPGTCRCGYSNLGSQGKVGTKTGC